MPDALERYIQDDFPVDKATVDELQKLIVEILEMFDGAFDPSVGAWPYQLVSGEPREASRVSFSTTAMIAYALALATGGIRTSSLAPAVGDPQGDDARVVSTAGHIDQAMHVLARRSAKVPRDVEKGLKAGDVRPRPWPPLTDSATFGPDDPFTLSWLVEVLASTKDPALKSFLAQLRARARARVIRVAKLPDGGVLQIRPQERVPHAFPLLRIAQLAKTLARGKDMARVADFGALRARFLEGIHLQLSESHIADGGFDAAELVFSLEGWLLASDAEPDFALIDEIFAVITANQNRTPYWRPLRPFKVTSQGLVLLPQSVEIANSLLRVCASPALEPRNYFAQHLALFKRYTSWLHGRLYRGQLSGGGTFLGWESEHTYTHDRIHLWQTSQVLIFLQHYGAMLQRDVASRLLQLAPLVPTPRPPLRIVVSPDAAKTWKKWRVGEPVSATAGSPYRVYERIENDFIRPRTGSSSRPPLHSMLLYGPPGTGKTTIAKKFAEALGFPLLKVTPSDFITSGGEAVEARAKAIFLALEEQRSLVVLFDEIDHLLLDRDSDYYREQGDVFKLLTPGMLTKINELREAERVIFIIATNYYERIDRAIKRPGRIDARYLVLPPDRRERRRFFEGTDGWTAVLHPDDFQRAVEATALFTYKELLGVVNRVQDALRASPRRKLATVLDATVRETKPIIDLGAYSARLGMTVDAEGVHELQKIDTVERPWEEVALLAYLENEVQGWPREPQWLPEAVRGALRSHVVYDQQIARKLRMAVTQERSRKFLQEEPRP